MRDASHYVPEGYLRAGMEAGVNAGIYNNSNKMVKPILLEYHTLKTNDTTVYERPVDKFIYDPCRVDLNFMNRYATNVATTAIALTAASTEVEIGKTLQLTCGFTPVNATDRDIVYSSSNTSLATVDGNGLVTGIAMGDVMITATLVSDPSITATITLEVVEAAAEDTIVQCQPSGCSGVPRKRDRHTRSNCALNAHLVTLGSVRADRMCGGIGSPHARSTTCTCVRGFIA